MHEKNIGLDKNQLAFVDKVKTKFCLMLADDDAIISGGLKIILDKICQRPDVEVMLLNAIHFSSDLKIPGRKIISSEKDVLLGDARDFFNRYFFSMHFSTLVVNMQYTRDVNYHQYIGTYHAYCGLIFEYLEKNYIRQGNNRILILGKPCIMIRDGKKTYSYENAKVHYVRLASFFKKMSRFYCKCANRKFKELMRNLLNPVILFNFRKNGQVSLNKLKEIGVYLGFMGKLKIYIFALMPVALLNYVSLLYRVITTILRRILPKGTL